MQLRSLLSLYFNVSVIVRIDGNVCIYEDAHEKYMYISNDYK